MKAIYTILLDGSGTFSAGIGGVYGKAQEVKNMSLHVGSAIFATMLVVALIFIVWALSTRKPHAKEYLIAWIIVVVFSITVNMFG